MKITHTFTNDYIIIIIAKKTSAPDIFVVYVTWAGRFPCPTDIMLGYLASLFHTSPILFSYFFFSGRPTQNPKTHSTINEENKSAHEPLNSENDIISGILISLLKNYMYVYWNS